MQAMHRHKHTYILGVTAGKMAGNVCARSHKLIVPVYTNYISVFDVQRRLGDTGTLC